MKPRFRAEWVVVREELLIYGPMVCRKGAASHARSAKMQPIVTDVPRSVCLSASLPLSPLDITVNCAKTGKPIEIQFGVWTRVGPRTHVSVGRQIPYEKGQFCGAPLAMWSFVKILWPLVHFLLFIHDSHSSDHYSQS